MVNICLISWIKNVALEALIGTSYAIQLRLKICALIIRITYSTFKKVVFERINIIDDIVTNYSRYSEKY